MFFSNQTRPPESRVKCWACMTLGKDNSIVLKVTVIIWMKPKSLRMKEENSNKIWNRWGWGGMSRLSNSNSFGRVNFDLISNVFPKRVVLIDFDFFATALRVVRSASFTWHLVKRYEIFIDFIDEEHWYISYENYFFNLAVSCQQI